MRHRPLSISALGIAFASTILLNGALFAQDLSQIRQQKPFTITGSIGTSNSFYTTNSDLNYRAPISNNVYANLNFSLYGIDIPFAFYYSNNNRGFSHPFLNYGMSPKYKAIQLHLGYRSMNFSPMVYQHQTFLGVGAEIQWKKIRLGGFKGSLNQARSMGDDAPRPSLYHRDAMGFKAGIGGSKTFVDFMVFAAKDDTTTIADTTISNRLFPKENIVAGTRMQFSFGRAVTIMADLAASAFNDDSRMEEIAVDELAPLDPWFKIRTGSRISYAGDIRAMLRFGKVNTVLQYKRVQPEYYSLGVPYFTNNLEMAGVSINSSFFKNRVMFGVSCFSQQNNLQRNQLYTNQNLVFNGTSSIRLSKQMNFSMAYNGFTQQQLDGTMKIVDSIRVYRLNQTFSLMPNYTLQNKIAIHSLAGNATLSENKNMNPAADKASDQSTMNGGLNYNITLKESKYSLSGNWNYTQSSSDFFAFRSNNFGIGAGKRLLKEGNLNLQFNSNIAFTRVENLSRNISWASSVSAGYTYQKNHSANIRLNYNNLNNYNISSGNALNGQDLLISFSYSYRFSVLNKEKAAKPNVTGKEQSSNTPEQ